MEEDWDREAAKRLELAMCRLVEESKRIVERERELASEERRRRMN